MQRRLVKLAKRAEMTELLTEGVDVFIGFQDDLLRFQAVIQRDIGALKRTVRRNSEARPSLDYLRVLRWYARCVGDALAWQVLLFDRKAIAALMSGPKPGVVEIAPNTQAVVTMAGHLLGQQFGVPIIHDITNWLRIGDITFMQPKKKGEWRFQTVELKSSVRESETAEDGVTNAVLAVNIWSNERIDLLTEIADRPTVGAVAPSQEAAPKRNPLESDRRLQRQLKRLDKMIERRDMKDNAMTTIEGVPNILLKLEHDDTHHWVDLRRAIRVARLDGFAFFSVDNFIAYALFYQRDGVTEEHMQKFRKQYVDRVAEELHPGEAANPFLLVREVPMKEEYDLDGFPIMRFFSYEIPQVAVSDLIHRRLVIAAVANWARLDRALVDAGVSVVGTNATEADQSLPYSIEISWPTGDKFRVDTPMAQVSREVVRAIYEFLSLEDVVQKVASIKLIPELISYDEWDASLKAQTADESE